MTENSFPFIVSDGPKLKNDPHTRLLIRKQAMKNVALERKKSGNYGRVNMGQLPILCKTTDDSFRPVVTLLVKSAGKTHDQSALVKPKSGTEASPIDLVDECQTSTTKAIVPKSDFFAKTCTTLIPSLLSGHTLFTDYEAARSKFQVSITDLSMLTNFNVSKPTLSILSADPNRLLTLLGHNQWSYLQFVPRYYGVSDCLTASTDCLLAKAQGLIMPFAKNESLELKLYAKALRCLQNALQDASSCMESDVLCATQLLSLYEVLGPTQDTAWSHHIQGAVRLVKYRTPARFESEFDKAMFAAHVGPIVFDALLGNKHCYLGEPEWLELYQSLICDSGQLDSRSPLAIGMRSQMMIIPGLWHDVDEAVTGPDLFNDEVISALQVRCRKAHRDVLDWMEEYKAYCMKHSLTSPSVEELAMRREVLGAGLECLVFTKRLLSSICDEERLQLEQEAQVVATMILDLQRQPSAKFSWLFSGNETEVAHIIVSTKEQWLCDLTYDSERERRLASRKRYMQWCNMLRPAK